VFIFPFFHYLIVRGIIDVDLMAWSLLTIGPSRFFWQRSRSDFLWANLHLWTCLWPSEPKIVRRMSDLEMPSRTLTGSHLICSPSYLVPNSYARRNRNQECSVRALQSLTTRYSVIEICRIRCARLIAQRAGSKHMPNSIPVNSHRAICMVIYITLFPRGK
jgi:hypothetical protein